LPKYGEKDTKTEGKSREDSPARPKQKSAASEDRLEQLRQRVAQRKEALDDAKNNPAEGDVQWIGNAGGGTRAVPSESYQRRLTELERALKEAEDDLRNAEKNR
jgi:hypothetical protein